MYEITKERERRLKDDFTLLRTETLHSGLRSAELTGAEKEFLLWLHGEHGSIQPLARLLYPFFMALNDDALDAIANIYPDEAEAVEHWQSGILREECERAWRAEQAYRNHCTRDNHPSGVNL